MPPSAGVGTLATRAIAFEKVEQVRPQTAANAVSLSAVPSTLASVFKASNSRYADRARSRASF